MRILLDIARCILWLETIMFLGGALISPLVSRGPMRFRTLLLMGLVFLTGLAALLANLFWRKRPALARRLAIGAAVPTLLVIPVGTLLGALQLVAFLKCPSQPPPLPTPPVKGISLYSLPQLLTIIGLLGGGQWLVYWSITARHGELSIWFIVFTLPLVAVNTLIHEAGHAWLTVGQGLQLTRFVIGPFHWTRLAAGWKLAFLPKADPTGSTGGLVDGSAREDITALPRRIAGILLGGPLANGVTGVVSLAFFLYVDPVRHPVLVQALGLAASSGLCGLVLNLIPQATPVFKTDGEQLRLLWQGGNAAAEIEAGFLRERPYWTPLRFRDIEVGPHLDPSSSDYVDSTLARYYQALDQSDTHAATHWLDLAVAAEAISPIRARDRLCATEAAWFAARNLGDPEARQRLNATFYGLPIDPFITLRAEASILLREGRLAEAHAATREAQRLLALCPATGWTALNSELLDVPDPASLNALQTAVEPPPLPVPQIS